jgi:MFS family permease
MAAKAWPSDHRSFFLNSKDASTARVLGEGSPYDQVNEAKGRSTLNVNSSKAGSAAEIATGSALAEELRGSVDITATDAPLSLPLVELGPVGTRNRHADAISVHGPSPVELSQEQGSPRLPVSQGVPPELGSVLAEIVFVLTCTASQVISSLIVGHITVTQTVFREALGIAPSQTPWLTGSTLLASGLSVIISGSLADLAAPKPLMVGAFLWEAIWNAVTAVAISPNCKILFFVGRAMNGLAVGVLVTTSMSILGRVYNPGIRKTRVFSFMAAGSPLGFWLGCVQGGALSAHLPWIFGSTSILLAICALAAHLTVPSLRPVSDDHTTAAPSLRQFDYAGAFLSSMGCSFILFGLTQGSSAHWNPYTYCLIVLGVLMLGGFYWVEQRVVRPIIPSGLWRTPGFAALLVSYFLGCGAYSRSLALQQSNSDTM